MHEEPPVNRPAKAAPLVRQINVPRLTTDIAPKSHEEESPLTAHVKIPKDATPAAPIHTEHADVRKAPVTAAGKDFALHNSPYWKTPMRRPQPPGVVIAEYFPSVARPATSAEKTSLAGYVKVQLELARDGGFRTLEPELEAFLHRLNSSQSVSATECHEIATFVDLVRSPINNLLCLKEDERWSDDLHWEYEPYAPNHQGLKLLVQALEVHLVLIRKHLHDTKCTAKEAQAIRIRTSALRSQARCIVWERIRAAGGHITSTAKECCETTLAERAARWLHAIPNTKDPYWNLDIDLYQSKMKEYMKLVEGHPRTWLQEMVTIVGESTGSAHWAKHLALARKWLADTQGQHLPASDAVYKKGEGIRDAWKAEWDEYVALRVGQESGL